MKKQISTLALYGIPVLVVVGLIVAIVMSPQENGAVSDSREVTPEVLAACIQHTNILLHIHPQLSITMNGQTQTIPANVGITDTCMSPVHTHDATGTLHIEYLTAKDFQLKHFFGIWGQTFSAGELMGVPTDATHRIRMLVDGAESTEYENLVLKDKQKIELFYEEIPQE